MPGTSARQRRPAVLITGASSGIGAAVAEQLARSGGWRLLLNGRDEDRLGDLAERTGGTPIPADLTRPGACATLIEQASADGGLDALVAGAGIGWAGPFAEISDAQIEEVLAINLGAVLHLARAVVPEMVARRNGRLVFVGSVAGCMGVRHEAVYSAAKGGLVTCADSLRYELADDGVDVSLVLPGAVDTPFFRRRGVPYHRARPRPVPAGAVAAAVVTALRTGRRDTYVPRWLGLPARMRGAAPDTFRLLARRFG